jgi:hypothetical protein
MLGRKKCSEITLIIGTGFFVTPDESKLEEDISNLIESLRYNTEDINLLRDVL